MCGKPDQQFARKWACVVASHVAVVGYQAAVFVQQNSEGMGVSGRGAPQLLGRPEGAAAAFGVSRVVVGVWVWSCGAEIGG